MPMGIVINLIPVYAILDGPEIDAEQVNVFINELK